MRDKVIQTLIATAPAVVLLTGAWLVQRRKPQSGGRAIEVVDGLAAALALLWFFRFGRFDWDRLDWQKEWTYFCSLQDAVVLGRIPYYLSAAIQDTNRYWGNIETLVAPHAVLLRVMNVTAFFLTHVLLVFGAGYAALVGLRRELELSPFMFTVFLVLFLLNGHITSHLAAGHTQWAGYFLLPWVFLCLVRAGRGDVSSRNGAVLALALGAMVAIGSWHVFVWAALFITLYAVTSRASLRFVLQAGTLVALLTAFRVLPALVTFAERPNGFLTGFNSLRMMFDALVIGRTASFARETQAWWEYDTYIGPIGAAIACLGLWPFRDGRYRALNRFLVPVTGLLLLSAGRVYANTLFRVPGFSSERITTRFLIVPVLAVLLLGCVRIDRWLPSSLRDLQARGLAALAASWLLAATLIVNVLRWRPLAAELPAVAHSVFLATPIVERSYFWTVWGGSAISLAALAVLAGTLIRRT